MHPAPFVWIDADGTSQMTHAYFRREFSLSGPCRSAMLHLFADTNYHLYVNGQFVGYGPVRSYPEFPCYDTYDLSDLLVKGANVIAVHVLHVGMATFHNLLVRGGLCAWGALEDKKGKKISFSTVEGWKCRKAEGYAPDTPRWSFAIGPIQEYDERLDPPGWCGVKSPAGKWFAPVPLVDQTGWGKLTPRPIPHLTQEPVLPQTLLGSYTQDLDQEIYSFRLTAEFDRTMAKLDGYQKKIAFACTHIFSPRAQTVTVGRWWGEIYLNGKMLDCMPERQDQVAQCDSVLDLHKGWNFLFASYGMVQGIWEFHLSVPRSAGLELAGDKKRRSKVAFLTAGPFSETDSEAILKHCPPDSPEAIQELAEHWTTQPHRSVPVSSTVGLAWAKFAEDLDLPDSQVGDLVIPADKEASLIFDMGIVTLGRIFVDFEAPAGTILDVGSAEELKSGRPHYKKMVLMSPGERHIARGGVGRMETFHPRGFRYLQLAVRNHHQPVVIRKLGVVRQWYPYTKQGAFECSDPFFNTLWEYGWNTLRLCSEDLIVDCPWRERTLYAGDLLPETATTMVATGDLRLVRHCVDVFVQSYTPDTQWLQSRAPSQREDKLLFDYPLIVMLIADWYCRHTQDVAFARRCAPIFQSMVEHVLSTRDREGFYIPDSNLFVEHRPDQMTRNGRLCTMNALVGAALQAWSSLLVMLGKGAEAKKMTRLAHETGAMVHSRFWDKKVGAFADSIQNSKLENAHHLVTSAWCLMFGQVDDAQAQNISRHIVRVTENFKKCDKDNAISPYAAFFLLGGLYEYGHEKLAEQMTRYIYGDMVSHPTGTIWENCTDRWSQVHAWCTAPNYYLSTRTLGVRMGLPDATAFDEILIAPQADTVDWARGVVPHPLGMVEVDWRIDGSLLRLNYRAPKGAKVTVAPQGRLAKLKLVVNC